MSNVPIGADQFLIDGKIGTPLSASKAIAECVEELRVPRGKAKGRLGAEKAHNVIGSRRIFIQIHVIGLPLCSCL
ncbi:hypothetical protein [Glutamicibacter arilaitensis]|uniref:hypothetical protein n=1 Tax=Glutamicibacter arilaitensis TaxID=256701 RepID=UPI003FD17C12